MAQLRDYYKEGVAPKLREKFAYKNVMQILTWEPERLKIIPK